MSWPQVNCPHRLFKKSLLKNFRFAETEMIAIVTMLVLRYRIEIDDDKVSPTETPEQRRARIIKLSLMVTAA